MLTAQQVHALMPDATELMSDEPEMESSLHYEQLALLVSCLEWLWRDRQDFFIGANLTVYYSREQLKNRDFRGPDFFLVKRTERKPRNSWVTWEEGGRYPSLIIELLSDSTAGVDRTTKKDLYQNHWQTREYFWFSPKTLEFCGFRLGSTGVYEAIVPTDQGWLWSQELDLYLGVRQGQLRYVDPQGQPVPTLQEFNRLEIQRAELECRRADAEAQRANTEAQRADTETQRADTETQRADTETQRADTETQRAEAEARKAEAEAQRANEAEARAVAMEMEVQRLRAQLQGRD